MAHVKVWDDCLTYTVEGRGQFPMDMLRKDMAWPNGTDDAAKIGQRGKRRITLTAHMARYVSVRRWESFGWKVLGADFFPYLEAARDNGLLEHA